MKRTALAVSTFTLLAAMAAFAQTTGQKSFDTMKSQSRHRRRLGRDERN